MQIWMNICIDINDGILHVKFRLKTMMKIRFGKFSEIAPKKRLYLQTIYL